MRCIIKVKHISFQNTKINSETIVPRIQTIFTGSVNDMGEYFLDPSEELPNLIGTHQLCSCVENLQYIFIITVILFIVIIIVIHVNRLKLH